MPVYFVEFSPTTRATHLNFDLYSSFVKQAFELGLEEIGLYATGEPFMTKKLEDY